MASQQFAFLLLFGFTISKKSKRVIMKLIIYSSCCCFSFAAGGSCVALSVVSPVYGTASSSTAAFPWVWHQRQDSLMLRHRRGHLPRLGLLPTGWVAPAVAFQCPHLLLRRHSLRTTHRQAEDCITSIRCAAASLVHSQSRYFQSFHIQFTRTLSLSLTQSLSSFFSCSSIPLTGSYRRLVSP